MTKAPNRFTSLLHRLGVAGPARLCVSPGTSAPKTSQGSGVFSVRRSGRTFPPLAQIKCYVPALLCAVVGALAFTAAPAFAGTPPEAPHTEAVTANTGTSATFNGTLNPGASPQAGTYEFLYKKVANGAGCEGESATLAGVMSGLPTQPVTEPTAVEPDTEYTVCLAATNTALPTPETKVGNAVPFKTLAIAPKIDSESVSNIKSSEATLEGAVNPNNQLTECHFQYGSSSVTENTIPCTPEQLKGYGEQNISPKNGQGAPQPIGGLTQGTEYHYRIVTKNGKGEEATLENHFRTAEEPEKKPAEPITATTATLNGVLDPHNSFEAGKYEFLYKQSEGECTGGSVTPAATSTTESPQLVEAKLTGLQPGATYTFCLLQRNASGEEAAISSPATFTAHTAAPTITGESAATVEATAATLEAQIDPDGAATTYHFEYDTTPYTSGAKHGTSLTKEGENTEVNIGAGTSPVPVEVKLKGLTPGATYYYRVLASNSLSPAGGTPGPDKTLSTPAAPGSAPPQSCPNEQLRAEQPYGLELPDCRAYEMVSPVDKNGSDATIANESDQDESRASVSGEAIVFTSRGSFADPAGSLYENQFLSRRGPGGWSTQSMTPQFEQYNFGTEPPYGTMVFTPELTKGVANTDAPLTGEAPAGLWESYLADFATGSYQSQVSGLSGGGLECLGGVCDFSLGGGVGGNW